MRQEREEEAAQDTSANLMTALSDLQELAADPFDGLAITALLESTGLRDVDASNRYGEPDLFAVGEALYPQLPLPIALPRSTLPVISFRLAVLPALRRFVAGYATGLTYLGTVVAQIIIYMILRYSLFAASSFTIHQATVVAMATLASLAITAPAVQGIARRGNTYLNLGNAHLARAAMRQISLAGLLLTCLAGVAIFIPWILSGGSESGRFFGYFSVLSVLWVAIARVDVCKQRRWVSPMSIGATMIVYLLKQFAGWQIQYAQWVAIGVLDLGLLALAEWTLWRWNRTVRDDVRSASLPPIRVLVARTWPVFVYGLMYYCFLFTDRIVCWTSTPLAARGWIAFRGDYEAALDWGLVVLFLSTSVLEYTIRVFSAFIIPAAEATTADGDAIFARAFLRLYIRQALILLLVSAAAVTGGYALLTTARYAGGSSFLSTFQAPAVRRVFLVAAIGYLLFSAGLFSAVFLQSLSKGGTVVAWLTAAVAVDAVVGVTATHVFNYEWAVAGLVAGGAVFAVLCGVSAMRLLRHSPYHLAATLA